MTSPQEPVTTPTDLMQKTMKWFSNLNKLESAEQSWLQAAFLPPLPPYCPDLPAQLGSYMRPQDIGPYGELPSASRQLRSYSGTGSDTAWLIAHFTKSGEHGGEQVQLHLTRCAGEGENLLRFNKDDMILTASGLRWETPPMHAPCETDSQGSDDDDDDDDDDDKRLVWNCHGDGSETKKICFKADEILFWLLRPCDIDTIGRVFPNTKELESGELLYHGSHRGPRKFKTTKFNDSMWFSHIPCPELNLGGHWTTKEGITWGRKHVYVYRVRDQCSLRLLNLTSLDDNLIHVPRGLRLMMEQAFPEVHQQAVLTETSTAARLMARSLLELLMTGRIFGASPFSDDDTILPDWLPVVNAETADEDEDWDSEALGAMASSSGLDGWYGCDYTQSSLQREVCLWSSDYGQAIEYVWKDGEEEEEEKGIKRGRDKETPKNKKEKTLPPHITKKSKNHH